MVLGEKHGTNYLPYTFEYTKTPMVRAFSVMLDASS